MSSDMVNVNPEDLKRLEKALERYQQAVKDAGKQVQKELDRVRWHDRQRDAFEAKLKGIDRTVQSFFDGDVKTMRTYLNNLYRDLEQLRARRM